MAKHKTLIYLTFFICCFFADRGNAAWFDSCEPCDCCEEMNHCGFSVGALAGMAVFDIKHVSTQAGYFVGGFAGCKLPYEINVEAEITFQRADIDSARTHGIKFDHVSGHIQSWSYMTNAFYAFDCDFPFEPYLGFGLGYAQSRKKWSGHHGEDSYSGSNKRENHNVRLNGFAWQAFAGALFHFCIDYEAGIDYRFEKLQEGCLHKLAFTLAKEF